MGLVLGILIIIVAVLIAMGVAVYSQGCPQLKCIPLTIYYPLNKSHRLFLAHIKLQYPPHTHHVVIVIFFLSCTGKKA